MPRRVSPSSRSAARLSRPAGYSSCPGRREPDPARARKEPDPDGAALPGGISPVDALADVEQAVEICLTAKTIALATCNAVERVLVYGSIADRFVPRFAERCAVEGVEMRGDDRVRNSAGG